MKKVLVLVAMFSLVASSAFAVISGGGHDMRLVLSDEGVDVEICAYCHTPHSASAVMPLWNRDASTTAVTVYTSGSVNNDAVSASILASDAGLCLSCHDNSIDAGTVTNAPRSAAVAAGQMGTTITWSNTFANIGSSLTNDHPIGFNYDAALVAADGQLHTKVAAEGATGMTGALSFGNGNEMWCSSCHDVHDNANTPFLVMANSGSDLCFRYSRSQRRDLRVASRNPVRNLWVCDGIQPFTTVA